jgi:hypothetical protein
VSRSISSGRSGSLPAQAARISPGGGSSVANSPRSRAQARSDKSAAVPDEQLPVEARPHPGALRRRARARSRRGARSSGRAPGTDPGWAADGPGRRSAGGEWARPPASPGTACDRTTARRCRRRCAAGPGLPRRGVGPGTGATVRSRSALARAASAWCGRCCAARRSATAAASTARATVRAATCAAGCRVRPWNPAYLAGQRGRRATMVSRLRIGPRPQPQANLKPPIRDHEDGG